MFIQVFLVGILAGMSPGPDFFVVMKNSLGFGRRSGIASALGIGTALAIHATYTILGIALILQHYVLLFKLIQLMGATYLVYLAIQTILSTFSKKNNQLGEDIAFEGNKSFQEGFKNGLLCNLLNPKAFLFFLSIFSQFISADTHSWIRWVYGLEVVCAITGWFVFLSYIISSRAFQRIYQKFRIWIDRFLGGVLLYFAFRIYKGVLSR